MAKRMHPEVKKYFHNRSKKLGKLRAKALTPARRSEIARMGGLASNKAQGHKVAEKKS